MRRFGMGLVCAPAASMERPKAKLVATALLVLTTINSVFMLAYLHWAAVRLSERCKRIARSVRRQEAIRLAACSASESTELKAYPAFTRSSGAAGRTATANLVEHGADAGPY